MVGSSGVDDGTTLPDQSRVAAAFSFPVLELRQYTLHDGQRDVLIDLFERAFVESQEAFGYKVIGTFTDLDRPNRFVWLRGFHDMESRAAGLSGFYDGPVWSAYRDEANATMVDSDNVLLLRAPAASAQFELPARRPALGERAPAGLVAATIYYLDASFEEAAALFRTEVAPVLEENGIPLLAWFVTESRPNNFPRLPVREDEKVLVWFSEFSDETDHAAHAATMKNAGTPLAPFLVRATETLRLRPTARSLMRGTRSAAGRGSATDFDFLHGRWNVLHRLIEERGSGSKDWLEYSGTAETRPLLGGLFNVEEHRIQGCDSGVALRCFDRVSRQWAIYWASENDGVLGPPVRGAFIGPEGRFEGNDTHDGRPVKVRFLWRQLGPDAARWEQSFSFDSGASWETNWIMEFERADV